MAMQSDCEIYCALSGGTFHCFIWIRLWRECAAGQKVFCVTNCFRDGPGRGLACGTHVVNGGRKSGRGEDLPGSCISECLRENELRHADSAETIRLLENYNRG